MEQTSAGFLERLRGRFTGIMKWDDLSILWGRLPAGGDWYVYDTTEPPPAAPLSRLELIERLAGIDAYLRREHDEDYCGIVYVDDPRAPTYIKVYDPNNLGVGCGFSDNPPYPKWILSLMPPQALPDRSAPHGWRRWLAKLPI